MKTTKFLAAVLALAAGLSMTSAVIAAPILNLYYDPANGNLKLQNTTSSTQSFQSIDVITLGNGTLGALSGQPGNQGFLSTGTATLPPSSFPVSNTNPNGYNGLYSQATAINVGSAVMTLSPYSGWSDASPIGPVGSYWDLGNIAITGMTQADLNARFLTDPEGTPPNFDTTSYGQFLFSYQTGPTTFSVTTPGNVVAVPEPSTIALAAVAAAIGGVGAVSKRRKKASMNAKRLATNA
jgi:hypothetical protein